MSTQLHIGGLSARTGHSIHAIRWYEAQGLIPGMVRARAGVNSRGKDERP